MTQPIPIPRPGRSVPIDPAKLRALRERAVLSQNELASLARQASPGVRVSRQLVTALESGASGASAVTVRALARALRVDPEELLAAS